MDPTIQLNASVEKAVDMVSRNLKKQDYRVVHSFDLQQAASAHPQCACPAHGTDSCTCQYLMLIAYPPDPQRSALTIAIHSHDGIVFISLIEGEETEWLGAMLPLMAETSSKEKLIEGETMSRKTFTVPSISCGHCTHTIQMEIGEIPGVQKVQAEVATKQVLVEWDNPATWDKIEAVLVEINHPPAA